MRILIAHNKYQFSGGEDAVAHDEAGMLCGRGHRVELLEEDNESIRGLRGKLVASTAIFYSARSRKRISQAIHEFKPDVIHIHNWFPLLSPSIIMEADALGVPTVQTLHNYRMLCANSLLYRNGAVCTDCIGNTFPVDGIVHGCYRGSRAGSAIVTAAYAFHRHLHTWDRVDLFIAVSEFEREVLVRGGLPAERVVVKPNFVASDTWKAERNAENVALFVGRISPEKGIRTLLSAWDTGKIPLRLKIIGDGPIAEEVRTRAAGMAGIEYLGAQPPDTVNHQMARARFLVFPSEWFETFGRTIIEAYSQGTPVLAADLGCARELVEEGVTGYRFAPGNVDALIEGANRFSASEDYEQMRSNCRKTFLNKFTAEINYTSLKEIYAKAIEVRMMRRHSQ